MNTVHLETGEIDQEDKTLRKKILKWKKPKATKRVESKYAKSEKHFWAQQIHYYFHFIMVGNGPDFFPYMVCLTLKLSGGVLLIVYTLGCVLIGMPMIYMEIFLGRYTMMANCQMYRMAPIFFGFGIMMILVNLFYLPLKVMQTSQFLINFMKLIIETHTFEKCPAFADETCFDVKHNKTSMSKGVLCHHTDYNCSRRIQTKYPTYYLFWQMFEGSDATHYPIWQLLIALAVTWILLCVILILGMRVIGLLIKIFTILIWVVVSIIFFMALIAEGSLDGLKLMVHIDVTKFELYQCVIGALFPVTKLGLLVPIGYMTASAYAKFSNRYGVGGETILLVTLNMSISVYFLAGIFAVAGAYAHAIKVEIDQVIPSYTGIYLAMIPGFLTFMDCPVTFILVYLFTFWMAQLVTIAVVIHLMALNLFDYFPQLGYFPNYVVISLCMFNAVTSIIVSLQVFAIFNRLCLVNYIVWCAVLHLFFESLSVFYCYGVNRLCDDIHFMTGKQPMKYWQVMWYFIPPFCLLFFIIIASTVTQLHDMISTLVHFLVPIWYIYIAAAMPFGSVVLAFTISFLFVVLVFRTFSANLLKPEFLWGPPRRNVRIARKLFAPRTSIRSQPPRRKRQRFQLRSIRQMHEQDIAEGVKKGRIFIDINFFRNVKQTGKIMSRQKIE